MRYLLELSGESKELAAAEAFALGGEPLRKPMMDGRAMVMWSGKGADELVSRLALAWSVSRHSFSCGFTELGSELDALELPGSTFRVRTSRVGGGHSPAEGAEMSKRAGKILSARYAVDLRDPDVEVRILIAKELHAGILCGSVDRTALEARKPERRPFNHPISLHPKLARAMVNLTSIMPDQTLLDPFCGTGGILLEAGIIGCKVLGGDMDPRMASGTALNLDHFGVKGHDVRVLDVSSWSAEHYPVDAIATDPPYGRSASTAKEPIESLYSRAFAACHAMLKPGGRLVMALPAEKHTELARGLFETDGMFPVRVHRSLTRYFCAFKKPVM